MTAQGAPEHGHFVGRVDLIADLTADLGDCSLRADSLTGPLGIGKTWLLEACKAAATDQPTGRFRTLYLNMDVYDPGCVGDIGEDLSLGAGIKNFTSLKRLGRDLVAAFAPDSGAAFETAIKTANEKIVDVSPKSLHIGKVISKVEAGQDAKVKKAGLTLNVASRLSEAFNRAGIDVTEALVDCLNNTDAETPALILVDNADCLVGQSLGEWLRSAIERLERAVVVLTFEPGASLDFPPGLGASRQIPPFSVEEVGLYLQARNGAASDPDTAEVIHSFSAGHPGIVDLLHKLLVDPAAGLSVDDLRERLVRLPPDPADRLAVLVKDMLKCFEGRQLDAAIQAASVPHRCDADLLKLLMKVGFGVKVANIGEVMRELEAFSFTDEFEEGTDNRYVVQVHPFIRRGLATQMLRYDRSRYEKMHAAAASYYFGRLTDEDRGYGEMFAYEQPGTQRDLREWLYHLAHTEETQQTLRQLVRIFLDAFWWWGNYVHFDFCEELATDIKHLAKETNAPGIGIAARMVRQILDAYPKRSHLRIDSDLGRYEAADWGAVQKALLQLRHRCGLSHLDETATPHDRQLRALLQIFLAHSMRYGDQGPEAGVAAYRDAVAMVKDAPQMGWDLAWVQFEQADLEFDLGQVEDALDGAATAAGTLYGTRANGVTDHELMSNLHRLRADCLWKRAERQEAAKEYGVACLHSYLYHAEGGAPDEYTMQHYLELRGRALERLLSVWAEDPSEAVRLAQLMRDTVPSVGLPSVVDLQSLLREGSLLPLADALFPREPEVAELHQDDSDFMNMWLKVDNAVGTTLDGDLPVNVSSRTDG